MSERPKEPTDKPYISPHRLEMYCKCGEQYRRRYIEGDKTPPGVFAHRGSGLHGAMKLNFAQKIQSQRDLPARDLVDASVAEFENALAREGVQLSEEEESRGVSAVLAEAKDDTAVYAEAFARLQAPDYQPLLVEERVRIELPSASHDLLGYLDLMDTQNRIVDFKTAAKSKPADEADKSVQLTAYAAAAMVRGLPPAEVRLDVLVGLKKGVKRQILSSSRGRADYQALVNRMNMVLSGISLGVFAPATPGSWWCSPKWCGYWRTCPYVNSERVALAQISGGGE